MAGVSQPTAEQFERTLRAGARERFGEEHAATIDYRLASYARLLARIAAEPLDFASEPPDTSGIEESDNGR